MTSSTPTYSAPAILRVSAIEELLRNGERSKALDLAQDAVAKGLVHARLHSLVAFRLEEQGRYEEAAMELGRGLALEPSNVELITSLGYCLLNLDRRADSLAMFRLAVQLDPISEPARYGLGAALKLNAAAEEAAAEFRKIVMVNPYHVHALADLASLAELRGDYDEARSFAEQALQLAPEQLGARIVLAKVALAGGDFAAAEAGAWAILETHGLNPPDRAEARMALADALDGLGRTKEAFVAYAEAKAELARWYGPSMKARESACAAAERTLAAFMTTPPERWAAVPAAQYESPVREHVFLIGFPRSGTTVLENVLAGHPEVTTLEERPTLIDAEAAFMTQPDGLERLSLLDGADLNSFRDAYWRRVRAFGLEPSGGVFIDKQPLGALMAPAIAKLFPSARIVISLRDPRDVVFSCFRRNFSMNLAMFEFTALERTARFYDVLMRATKEYFARLPLSVHEVRYEKLVKDFDSEAKAACAFLGVDWSDAMRDFAKTARARNVRSRSSNQVVEGLNAKGVAQWRRYDWAIESVLPIVKPWIEYFGYAA